MLWRWCNVNVMPVFRHNQAMLSHEVCAWRADRLPLPLTFITDDCRGVTAVSLGEQWCRTMYGSQNISGSRADAARSQAGGFAPRAGTSRRTCTSRSIVVSTVRFRRIGYIAPK